MAEKRNANKAKDQGDSVPTKNNSQVAQGSTDGRKVRRTAKGEPGSRKPGTELSKKELAAQEK